MKKFLAILMTLLFLTFCAFAEAAPTIYISITDDTGALVLAYAAVSVTDSDGDGALTIADALACAHAQHHEKGADAFITYQSEFGLSMQKLWGVDNGGSYGYYLNNASAWSLLDPVAEGDHVKAYVYTDLAAWSDTYAFFAADTMTVSAGEQFTLTLSAAGWDENYAPVTLAVEGAVITVNGESTQAVTDAQGSAQLTIAEPGVYVISAQSDAMTLVAPVCIVTVQ